MVVLHFYQNKSLHYGHSTPGRADRDPPVTISRLVIAKQNSDPELRRKAIFWLGQSEDPRALSLFEELLTKP